MRRRNLVAVFATGSIIAIIVFLQTQANSTAINPCLDPSDPRLSTPRPMSSPTPILFTSSAEDSTHFVEPFATLEHEGAIFSIAFSPDGSLLVAAESWKSDSNFERLGDNRIWLWDTTTWEQVAVLEGHENRIENMAFSPDGRMLASGSWDRTVRVWEVATGAEVIVLRDNNTYTHDVGFTPDGTKLITASGEESALEVWDTATYSQVTVLNSRAISVDSSAISPDGKCLVISEWPEGSTGGSFIKLVDAETGEGQRLPHVYRGNIVQVEFSPDGGMIASSGADATVRLWDVATQQQIAVIPTHYLVAFSPNRRILATGIGGAGQQEHFNIRLWDLVTRTALQTLQGSSNALTSIAFSPDGRLLAASGRDGVVQLWNIED